MFKYIFHLLDATENDQLENMKILIKSIIELSTQLNFHPCWLCQSQRWIFFKVSFTTVSEKKIICILNLCKIVHYANLFSEIGMRVPKVTGTEKQKSHQDMEKNKIKQSKGEEKYCSKVQYHVFIRFMHNLSEKKKKAYKIF